MPKAWIRSVRPNADGTAWVVAIVIDGGVSASARDPGDPRRTYSDSGLEFTFTRADYQAWAPPAGTAKNPRNFLIAQLTPIENRLTQEFGILKDLVGEELSW